jgi:short-subunit dehydrogenase
MVHYKGKTALITGASSGIGLAFANYFGKKGSNLILVARDASKLNEIAAHLKGVYHITVSVIPHDLREAHSGQTILEQVNTAGLEVDFLVNNAGVATYGAFESVDAALDHNQIMTNVNSLVDLTHAFMPQMVERGEGAVINLASVLSFLPLPQNSVYAATKAFVLSFSEALHAEYASKGIRIFALCPGPTASAFFTRMGMATPKNSDTPDDVVWRGMKAFEKGKAYKIPNASFAFQMGMLKFMPRKFVYQIARGASKSTFKK